MDYENLKTLSEEQLIEKFNKLASEAELGPLFFREELARRENERINDKMLQYTHELAYFTRWITLMTLISTVVTIISVVLTYISIYK